MSADNLDPEMPVTSPCVGICALDADGYCIGCFRSGTELADWAYASEDAKRAILARCRARREEQDGRRRLSL